MIAEHFIRTSLDATKLASQTVHVTGIGGGLRRANLDDLDRVLGLDHIAPIVHERSELLTSRVHSREVIVFEEHDRLLGFAVVKARAFFGRDFVELLTVVVDNRRRGVGTVLLEEAVRESSTDRIFTSTNRSNDEMIGLLNKTGWQFSGQLEGVDEGDPELVYYKDSLAVSPSR